MIDITNSKNLYYRMKRRLQKSIQENHSTIITCESCGARWSPMIRIGGRLPNKWWICPICENNE